MVITSGPCRSGVAKSRDEAAPELSPLSCAKVRAPAVGASRSAVFRRLQARLSGIQVGPCLLVR